MSSRARESTGAPAREPTGAGPMSETAHEAFWHEQARPGPDTVVINGVAHGRGDRVRLRPRPRGDIFDLALAGRIGAIESIEATQDGALHVAIVLDTDPGRDLGLARMPGHRFFFTPAELETLPDSERRSDPAPVASEHSTPLTGSLRNGRILVAGIGNLFLGDDGFGCHVARRLASGPGAERPGVEIRDFGIRGMDLAYALADYDAALLIDAMPRGQAPGTLYLVQPEAMAGDVEIDTHAMGPARVLALAATLGPLPPRLLVLGCEPLRVGDSADPEVVAELSPPVERAVTEAVRLAESVLADLAREPGRA